MGSIDREFKNLKITVEPAGLEEESKIKASAEEPESLKRKESSASEEEVDADADLIRRLKKEAMALLVEDAATEDLPVKKKRKIIKQRVPQGLIDYLMECPDKQTRFRSAKEKAITDKVLEYEQALINQYLTKGYAEDEVEVTDDESDEN